jgi:hypothetical protein
MAGQEYQMDYDLEDREYTKIDVFNAHDDIRRINAAKASGSFVLSPPEAAPEPKPDDIDHRPPIFD